MKKKLLSLLLAAAMLTGTLSSGITAIAAEEETSPVTEETIETPADGEETKPEDTVKPAEGETTPTEGETTPSEGAEAKPEDTQKPTEGETTPSEGEEAKPEDTQKPAEGETTPTEGEETKPEDAGNPAEGEEAKPENAEKPAGSVPMTELVAAAPTAETLQATTETVDNISAVRKEVMLGTDGLKNYDASVFNNMTAEEIAACKDLNLMNSGYDYIWFGTYDEANGGRTVPMKWRVLDKDRGNDGNGEGMFLLSHNALWADPKNGKQEMPFNARDFVGTDGRCNNFQESEVREWCQNFGTQYLTSAENAALLSTTKTDPCTAPPVDGSDNPYSTHGRLTKVDYTLNEKVVNPDDQDPSDDNKVLNNILNGDKVFPLSVEEAEKEEYGFVNLHSRWAPTFGKNDFEYHWWLRTPYDHYNGQAVARGSASGIMNYMGFVKHSNSASYDNTSTLRPACNLDKDRVMFMTNTHFGKQAYKWGLTSISDCLVDEKTGSERGDWALTILDDDRMNFQVDETPIVVEQTPETPMTLEIPYRNAKVGELERISVMVMDQETGELIRYSTAFQPETVDGTLQIPVVEEDEDYGLLTYLNPGRYTLKIFNEQVHTYSNGDRGYRQQRTDYSSPFREVQLTVQEAGVEQTVTFKQGEHGKLEGETAVQVKKGEKIPSVPSVVPDEKYKFEGWQLAGDSENKLYTETEIKEMVVTGPMTFIAQYGLKWTDLEPSRPITPDPTPSTPDRPIDPDKPITPDRPVTPDASDDTPTYIPEKPKKKPSKKPSHKPAELQQEEIKEETQKPVVNKGNPETGSANHAAGAMALAAASLAGIAVLKKKK